MPQSEKPREFTLRARHAPGMRVLIPEWVVLATPKPAVPPEDVRVVEAEPVERELADLRERAEQAEARTSELELELACEESVSSARERAAKGFERDCVRLKEGIKEAHRIIATLRPTRWPGYGEMTTASAASAHAAIDSWLAAYCPIPTDRADMRGEEETR